MSDPITKLLNERVVLDTAGSVLYFGTLAEVTDAVFVLTDADLHDCRDGHADKETYTAEIAREGVAINRSRIVVMRGCVMSLSRLADVVAE